MTNLQVPSPRTFGVSEVEVAAYMNAVRDSLNFLLNAPMASLYQNVSQNIATTVWTAITMDSSLLDTYGGHSNTVNPSRYVAQVAGWCSVGGGAGFVANATGGRGADVYKNGAFITAGAGVVGTAGAGASHVTPLSGVMAFANVGDYLEIFGWQNGANPLATATGQYASYAFIRWEHS